MIKCFYYCFGKAQSSTQSVSICNSNRFDSKGGRYQISFRHRYRHRLLEGDFFHRIYDEFLFLCDEALCKLDVNLYFSNYPRILGYTQAKRRMKQQGTLRNLGSWNCVTKENWGTDRSKNIKKSVVMRLHPPISNKRATEFEACHAFRLQRICYCSIGMPSNFITFLLIDSPIFPYIVGELKGGFVVVIVLA